MCMREEGFNRKKTHINQHRNTESCQSILHLRVEDKRGPFYRTDQQLFYAKTIKTKWMVKTLSITSTKMTCNRSPKRRPRKRMQGLFSLELLTLRLSTCGTQSRHRSKKTKKLINKTTNKKNYKILLFFIFSSISFNVF